MDFLVTTQLSTAELEARYLRVAVNDSQDPALRFSLLISRKSARVPIPATMPTPDKNKVMLALFGREGEKFGIEVDAVLIQREMSAADWLFLWMSENGYSVRAQRLISSRAGDQADVLAIRTVDGADYIYRLRTYKDGHYIYLVEARGLLARYTEYADEFFIATSGFSLSHPVGDISAEPLRSYDFMAPVHASVTMPASWKMSPDPHSPPNGSSMRFTAEYGPLRHVTGNIIVAVMPLESFKTPRDAEWPFLSTLGDNGFQVSGADLQPLAQAQDAWHAERQGSRQGEPMKAYTVVLKRPEGWVLFGMISPEPEIKAAGIEQIDRRALDIAVSSFHFSDAR